MRSQERKGTTSVVPQSPHKSCGFSRWGTLGLIDQRLLTDQPLAPQPLKQFEEALILFDRSASVCQTDTNETFAAALAMYRRRGYKEIPRFNDNPQATIFMRKRITP
ncbi:hypothetical protein SAMN05421819_0087 [Bryocella elongata]|uniref:N-acetyltransferase domain-containing protein n=1 Tax=Bryocella elongata TaxID=863522 RepID=A0A1H5S5Y2_9BACT|nr:hypothetical protein [Bryocella elongata]SEF46015.1 hypothetical protein SAMN05421819_0087 [Bryocella elongata]